MKSNCLKKLDGKTLSLLKSIGRQADKDGCRAYVVGGFVRDTLLNRKNLDIDVVVEGEAAVLAKRWSRKRIAKVVIHDRFKTASVKLNKGFHIDFTSARKENYAHPGALPVVKFGAMRDDLFRRDFTINAIAACLNRKEFGKPLDEFNGFRDLKEKKIRVLHDRSFTDDPTRVLRAVRFEQRFGFRIEAKTLKLLKRAVRTNKAKTVKPERYFAEFKKYFYEKNLEKHFKRLIQLDALKFLGIRSNLDLNLLKLISKSKDGDQEKLISMYLMGMLCNEPDINLRRIFQTFNFKRTDRSRILKCRDYRDVLRILNKAKIAPSLVYQVLEQYDSETIEFFKIKAASRRAKDRIRKYSDIYKSVKPELNGLDLKRLRVPNGKNLGMILSAILYQKLDGKIRTRKAELREVNRLKAILK